MIVQCELCSTRFKLDDSKVREEGVRVRCSKCRHIFIVRKVKLEASEDPDFDSFLNELVAGTSQGSDLLKEYIPDTGKTPVVHDITPVNDVADESGSETCVSASEDLPERSERLKHDEIPEEPRILCTDFNSFELPGEALSQATLNVVTSDPPQESGSVLSAVDHFVTPDSPRSSAALDDVFPEPQIGTGISADDPLPPAQINRKLAGSRLPFVLTMISVLAVIVLAGAGLLFMNNGTTLLEKTSPGGGISIRNTVAEFVQNKDSGELFVVKGVVVNVGSVASGPLQLKATLYDAKGIALVSKKVYCGNSLTREQLTLLPANKLDEAMGGASGSPTPGSGVPPGEGAPFMVLFQAAPKNAAEYGIEVLNTTGS